LKVRAAVGRIWSVVALPVIAILLSLVVGSVIIIVSQLIVSGGELDLLLPIKAYAALIQGAVGSETAIINTIAISTPLVLGGLSVAFGFRAGLFNIGAQGQFWLGLVGAVWVGVTLRDAWPPMAITLSLLGGLAAGALWGFIPGLLKAVSGAHEVVTTIMLNNIAGSVLAWVVSGPLRVPGAPAAITEDVGNSALPILLGRNGHAGFLIALAAVGLVSFVLSRTTFGYEVKTVGANPDAARYAGMRPRRLIVLVMTICGALAGLAGAGELLGIAHKTQTSYATSVGFDSIAIALLGRSSPVGVLLAALLFGGMRAGSSLMQIRAGIPAEIVDVLQATILLFLVANEVIRRWFRLGGVKPAVGTGETTITKTYGKEAIS
jgi:general nucleoside transport system permease protein